MPQSKDWGIFLLPLNKNPNLYDERLRQNQNSSLTLQYD